MLAGSPLREGTVEMKAAILSAGALVCVCLLASGAAAGTISISIAAAAELRDGKLVVAVTVANSGDEAAAAVTPELRFRGQAVRGTRSSSLEPGGAVEETLAVPAGDLGEGRWPYQVAVSYTDTNQYPFEALHVALIELGNPPPAQVAVTRLEAEGVFDSGDLEARVKNLSEDARDVRVDVLVPGAIEVKGPEAVALAGWAEQSVAFELTNRAALAGSRYPLFVALEYEDGSVHQTLVSRGEVEILGEEARLGPSGRLLWIGAAIFGLVFVVLLGLRLARP